MSGALWVIGGEQRLGFTLPKEWSQYRKALVLRIEPDRTERVLEYASPPAHCPDDTPSHVFKAATLRDDTAYLCTQTEVLICDLPNFAIRRVISHPCFNDLHHVAPAPDGRLFVAVTGLDAVAELSPAGAWVGFSRIRYTTLRRNLSWLRHGFRETEHHNLQPTRIALYDLEQPALLEQIDLEPAGMGAVFSIHAA